MLARPWRAPRALEDGENPMQNDARINMLARVARAARSPATPAEAGRRGSILSLAAASYGSRPSGDATVPTGFDPLAVALFEAIVEGAFIVANADGVFDDEERRTFERVVVAACGETVAPTQIAALVADLGDQLQEDGADRRIEAIARSITKKEHAQEILRIAALLAYVSEDVSDVERQVLGKLARRMEIDEREVDVALAEAKEALAG
jgi:tellurite resistance protein